MVHDARSSIPPKGRESVLALKDPRDQLKLQILQDRLNLSSTETLGLLESLRAEAARQLGIPAAGVAFDAEFQGREMDLIFTLDMQNLPPIRKKP